MRGLGIIEQFLGRGGWRMLAGASTALALVVTACAPPAETPAPLPTPNRTPLARVTPSPSPGVARPPASPVALQGPVAVTANSADQSLSVIDVTAARVVGNIPVGRPVHNVALAPEGRLAAATDPSPGSREIVIADLTMMRTIAEVTVGSQPKGIAIDPMTGTAAVANSGDDTVGIIDLSARRVMATVQPVGQQPHGVGIVNTDGTAKIFVSNEGDGTVSVIDMAAQAVTDTIQVGQGPTRVVPSPQQDMVFVLNEGAGTVSVIDTRMNRQMAEIQVAQNLTGLAVTPDGRFLFASADDPTRNLWKIDLATNQVVQDFNVGAGALSVTAGPLQDRILVTTTDNRLVFFDTNANRATATLDVGQRPEDAGVVLAGGGAPGVQPAGTPTRFETPTTPTIQETPTTPTAERTPTAPTVSETPRTQVTPSGIRTQRLTPTVPARTPLTLPSPTP